MKQRARLSVPFRSLRGNVMVDGDKIAAVYRVDTTSYEFLSDDGKHRLMRALAWWAYHVEADFSLYRVSREYPADTYVGETVGLVDDRMADPDAWERLLEQHAEHIGGMRAFDAEVYVAVALRRPARLTIRRRSDNDGLDDAEAAAYATLSDHLSARRATTDEVQWLVRRAGVRGVGEPQLDPNWVPPAVDVDPPSAWQPVGSTLVRLMATLEERDRSLIVDSDDGRSFQSVLAVGALPRTSQFPGNAELLFAPLEALDFPVDATMHVRWRSNDDMRSLAGKRVRDADNAFADQAHNPQSWAPEENRRAARDVQAYFADQPHPPALEASILLAVGAPDADTLKSRIARLRKRYGATRLYLPYGIQAQLYADCLPRPDGGKIRDYSDFLTIEQFGALMPIGTHHAGARRGIYIGHTVPGAPRPVKLDLTEASRTHRAPSVLLVGTLGSGKTVSAQLLAWQAAMRGSLVVDVDPRPDHNLEGMPGLEGRVHVIDLSADGNDGLLDPLVVAPDALREDLAASYLMEILPQTPPGWATQIRKAVKAVLIDSANVPSCHRVLDVMRESANEDARLAAEALEVWADSSLGRLAFGRVRVGHTARAQVTTIKAENLALPPAGVPRADYDPHERMSVATLKLLVGYAMRLVSGDRSMHKVVHFDEAHLLLSTGDGRRFLDRVNRMGRSMNATMLLSTQLLGDVGDLESLIGTRLIFGQQTADQARSCLPVLGLDPSSERLVGLLTSFRKGRCLMSGIDGRVAAVQIDPVDPRILEILNTAPSGTTAERLDAELVR